MFFELAPASVPVGKHSRRGAATTGAEAGATKIDDFVQRGSGRPAGPELAMTQERDAGTEAGAPRPYCPQPQPPPPQESSVAAGASAE